MVRNVVLSIVFIDFWIASNKTFETKFMCKILQKMMHNDSDIRLIH